MSQLVIGAGEVGRAIAEVLGCDILDVHDPEAMPRRDVLHICFPYSDTFLRNVRVYQYAYRPSLTIIHSTVPVGTSRRVGAVHSPVTGRHPNLAEGVRTFRKFFGGTQAPQAAALFARHWVKVATVPDQETTEAGKLWQTLQYGWLIALQKKAYEWMDEVGADPTVAYDAMNEEYNVGYAALGDPWYLPIMRDIPGEIGGHCVIPNARLTPVDVADWLVSMNEDWK